MRNLVGDNLPRSRLRSLNCILPGVAIKNNVQLRHLGNPTVIEFAIELVDSRKSAAELFIPAI